MVRVKFRREFVFFSGHMSIVVVNDIIYFQDLLLRAFQLIEELVMVVREVCVRFSFSSLVRFLTIIVLCVT